MQGRQKRKERLTNPIKNERESNARRSSLSSKMFSQLSMSFYGETTIRKNKQVIMDDCAFDFKETQPKSELLQTTKAKLVKSAPKHKKQAGEAPFSQKQKDRQKEEIDFRTTQDSKMGSKNQAKNGMLWVPQKSGGKLVNKSKLNSLQKFRKLLLADIVQSRVKTSKALVLKRQPACTKKL